MDSYVVSCKYVEPQFPPCEEDYSNFSDHGGYYNPQDSGSYGGGYHPQPPPPAYTPQQTSYQHPLQEQHPGQEREDEDHLQNQGAPFPGYRASGAPAKERFFVGEQCQAWVTCKPAQVQRKATCQGKDKPPIVVYPWMKKVHIAQGKISCFSLCRPTPCLFLYLSQYIPPSLFFAFLFTFACPHLCLCLSCLFVHL